MPARAEFLLAFPCYSALVKFRHGGNLHAKIGKRRSDRDQPHREGGKEIEVESEHYEIERAMDRTVQHAKSNEDPGCGYVRRVHLFRGEEIECERIENHRNLEQVLQVVRWIGHRGRRELSERAGTARSFELILLLVMKLMRRMYMYTQTTNVRSTVAKRGPKIAACVILSSG